MKKFKIKNCFYIFFIIYFIGYSEPLLEEIIAGMKYQESLIKSWKVTCRIIKKYTNGKRETINEVWVKKGDKIYREKILQKDNGEEITSVSFDGEILRVLSSTVEGKKRGVISVPTKGLLTNAFFSSLGTSSLFNMIYFENKSIIECLQQENNSKTIQEISFSGEKCYLIKWNKKQGMANLNFEVYISPKQGFLPIRIIEKVKSEDCEMQLLTDNTYTKYDNIYFLKKCSKQWIMTKNVESSEGIVEIEETEIENIEINKDIPDSFFEIKFPKGTKVYDERTGITYEVK